MPAGLGRRASTSMTRRAVQRDLRDLIAVEDDDLVVGDVVHQSDGSPANDIPAMDSKSTQVRSGNMGSIASVVSSWL